MQRTLVFTREERLLLIEAATLTPHVSRTIALRLKGLLRQLEFTNGAEGCFPGQELLAAKLGTTKRTIGKWVAALRRLRILHTKTRRTWAGRRQLDYHVDWSLLRSFCTADQLTTIEEKLRIAPKNFASRCEAGSSRDAKPVRRPYRNNSNNSSSAAAVAAGEGDDFQKLVQEVAACGVDQALPAVNAALAVGCTSTEIRAAIAHYRTLTNAGVTPGALYVKLMKMQPGEAANRRFPKGDERIANRQFAARQALASTEQTAREADTAARERAELQQLESEHGQHLDQLGRDECLALLEQTGSPELAAALVAEFLRKPTSALVRAELLKLLSRKESIA